MKGRRTVRKLTLVLGGISRISEIKTTRIISQRRNRGFFILLHYKENYEKNTKNKLGKHGLFISNKHYPRPCQNGGNKGIASFLPKIKFFFCHNRIIYFCS